MSLIYNATFDSQTRILSLLDKAGNVISSCEVPSKEPLVDDPNKPLMLRAIADNSSVSLKKNGTLSNTYQTSTDGTNWTDYTLGTQISLNKGESVYFRCSNHPTTQSGSNFVQFVMTGEIEAWHNAYSMISSDFSSAEVSVGDYGMGGLFKGCASLTKAPLLLNALAPYCYYVTLLGTSITQAPALPATNLAEGCYSYMFERCRSLTQAPELPATTLADHCYKGMFNGCHSLTQAPELPATTLASNCYRSMFRDCSSLTQAPELPATTLTDYCYLGLFSGCSKLNQVRISATKTAKYALDGWLYNVSATGDFYCDPNAMIFQTNSASGIPKGWTRHDTAPVVDDITKPLTFKATQDGSTVTLKNEEGLISGAFQTSSDGGNTWEDYTIDTAIALNTGDEVSFRAKEDRSNPANSGYIHFMMEGKIEAWHNVMSLYRKDDFATYNTVWGSWFYYLFKDCASLTKAPVLPATTLASGCYSYMFSGCQSLTEAPELPATRLAPSCYQNMFWDCVSLIKAPELTATELYDNCYKAMFQGCGSLNEVRCQMPSSYTSYDILRYTEGTVPGPLKKPWLSGVSSTGTFYTNADANWPSGASGIPEGWTRVNI